MKTVFLILTFASPFILLSQEKGILIVTYSVLDTDQDGYPDEFDDEPLTPPGIDVDRNGVRLIANPPCDETVITTTLHLEPRPEEVCLFLIAKSVGVWNWVAEDSIPFLVTRVGEYTWFNDSESYRLALMAIANLECYASYPAMKIKVIGPAEDGQAVIDKLKRDFFLPEEGVRISYKTQQTMSDPVAYFFWE